MTDGAPGFDGLRRKKDLVCIGGTGWIEAAVAACWEDLRPLWFPDAPAAIGALEDLDPEGLLVLDDGDPAPAVRLLRAVASCRDLPLVVVTVDRSPEKERKLLEAGANALLPGDGDRQLWRARWGEVSGRIGTIRKLRAELAEKDDFIRTVTHDLKTPVAGISSAAELLANCAEGGDLAEVKELAGLIQATSGRALEFIQDLLNLLRSSTRIQDVAEVPAGALVEAALLELRPMVEASGAEILVPKDLPTIPCDRKRMVQVFTNLLGNAIKYVPRGVRPRIRIGSYATPGEMIFIIADNGIGMDPRDAKKIFQAFVRLPDAAEYEGTGLGLSIVKRIVESHEGEVSVVSQRGVGSEFYVTLPARPSFAAPIPAPAPA